MFRQFEADGLTPAYFQTAREHEAVFRGILRHVKSVFPYVPEDFDVDAPIDELLARSDPRPAYGRFVVSEFVVGRREGSNLVDFVEKCYGGMADNEALIAFGSIAMMSGASAAYRYEITSDETPMFVEAFMETMS